MKVEELPNGLIRIENARKEVFISKQDLPDLLSALYDLYEEPELEKESGEWTPIESACPSNERPVLVLCGDISSVGHYYVNGSVWVVDGEYTNNVTHWKEMPDGLESEEQHNEAR